MCNFIPFVHFLSLPASLVFAIYLGIKGNRIMAANRQFASLADFVAVQTAWAKWGLIVFVVSVLLGIFLLRHLRGDHDGDLRRRGGRRGFARSLTKSPS